MILTDQYLLFSVLVYMTYGAKCPINVSSVPVQCLCFITLIYHLILTMWLRVARMTLIQLQ